MVDPWQSKISENCAVEVTVLRLLKEAVESGKEQALREALRGEESHRRSGLTDFNNFLRSPFVTLYIIIFIIEVNGSFAIAILCILWVKSFHIGWTSPFRFPSGMCFLGVINLGSHGFEVLGHLSRINHGSMLCGELHKLSIHKPCQPCEQSLIIKFPVSYLHTG